MSSIIQLAAAAFGVPETALTAPARGIEPIATARMVAMAVIHRKLKMSHDEIARLFNRERSTVKQAIKRVAELEANDLRFKNTFQSLLAGVVIPYHFRMGGKTCIQKTNARPKARFGKPDIDLGIQIFAHVIGRKGGRFIPSRGAIASVCGCSTQLIKQIEDTAIKKVRERLRRDLCLTYADMLSANSKTV